MTSDDSAAKAGSLLFAVLFAVFALWLALQIGTETKFSSRGQLFAQPRFWPAVGVCGMLLFGLAHLISCWRHRAGDSIREGLTWIRAFEFLIWFMVYVYAVPVIGYLLATIIFTFLLTLRAGYRQPRHLMAAVAAGICIVLVFKTGLSVKIPGGAIYDYLPDALRNFMIVNF